MKETFFTFGVISSLLLFSLSCHKKGEEIIKAPVEIVGFVETPGYARGIQVVGDLAYVACSQAGLSIIDISDPVNPSLLSTLDWVQQDVARAVYIQPGDTLLYLADTDDGIPIVSVSNLDSLRYVGSYWGSNILDVYGVLMDSSLFLCVADQDDGLFVLEAVGGFLTERSSLVLPATPRGVFARGQLCFVADAELGLLIVRMADPENIELIGEGDTPGYAYAVYVRNNLAYVADGYEGLQIIDVSDSTNPVRLGRIDLAGLARGVVVDDTLAFVACGSGGFSLVNVTDPESPKEVYSLDLPYTYDVDFKDNYIFVSTRVGVYTIQLIGD